MGMGLRVQTIGGDMTPETLIDGSETMRIFCPPNCMHLQLAAIDGQVDRCEKYEAELNWGVVPAPYHRPGYAERMAEANVDNMPNCCFPCLDNF